eukprot:415557_1
MVFTFCLMIHIVLCHSLLKADKVELNTFQVVYKDKSFKLSSYESVDDKFLSQIFNVKSNDIIGLQRQDGLLIRLTNDHLGKLVNGKVVALKVIDNEQYSHSSIDECQETKGYYNVKPNNIEIITFSSVNDSGKGAIKQMQDWLHNINNKDVIVIDIESNYFTTATV